MPDGRGLLVSIDGVAQGSHEEAKFVDFSMEPPRQTDIPVTRDGRSRAEQVREITGSDVDIQREIVVARSGWDALAATLGSSEDAEALRKALAAKGVTIEERGVGIAYGQLTISDCNQGAVSSVARNNNESTRKG